MNKRRVERGDWVASSGDGCDVERRIPGARTDRTASYRSMAPVEQYLMPDRNAEIALARGAAAGFQFRDATVLVLGAAWVHHRGEREERLCVVSSRRGWMSPFNAPQFWNPKMRGPICFNPAAAHSILPLTLKRSDLVLSGLSAKRSSDGRHPSCAECEGTSNVRTRGDELHDVEARVPGRWRRPLGLRF